METSLAPQMQTLPNCLATSAACEDTPPRDVRMPWESSMPFKSSGEVSVRQRTTLLPFRVSISAVAAVKAIRPVAAPGPAAVVLVEYRPAAQLPLQELDVLLWVP